MVPQLGNNSLVTTNIPCAGVGKTLQKLARRPRPGLETPRKLMYRNHLGMRSRYLNCISHQRGRSTLGPAFAECGKTREVGNGLQRNVLDGMRLNRAASR